MSAATDAYTAAERLIAEAKEEGVSKLGFNQEDFRALETLPPQIAELTELRSLDFDKTALTDLAPLFPIAGNLIRLWLDDTKLRDFGQIAAFEYLESLSLSDTSVRDLGPLSGLRGLLQLYLNGTSVRDLGPLSGLRGLLQLSLNGTSVRDLGPLSGLRRLSELDLSRTSVHDLGPLSGLTQLRSLDLDNTPVLDLRPLAGMVKLAEDDSPFSEGFGIENTAAAKADARIAEIAEIKQHKERGQALLEYLKTLPPYPDPLPSPPYPRQSLPVPSTPTPEIAPLQTQVAEGRLRRIGGHGLPEQDAMARAEAGWRALKQFRDVFGKSCNVHNYGQLVAVLDGFDEAMGDKFEPDRMILIGVMGQAVVALSDDDAFKQELPTGAPALLMQFGVQIDTFLNRFPDWNAYLDDADTNTANTTRVAAEKAAFSDVQAGLQSSAETDVEVSSDYALQVREGTRPDSDPVIAGGLVASTREVTRALSEVAVEGLRSGRIVRSEVKALESVHDTELAKVKWYAGGFAIVLLRRQNIPLRRLARQFPKQLSWLNRVLDYIGAGKEDE